MNETSSPPAKVLSAVDKPAATPSSPLGEGMPTFETMDRVERAVAARLTHGISPHALYAAWFDWASHLANAPGRVLELGLEAVNASARFAQGKVCLTCFGSRPSWPKKPGGRAPRAKFAA